MFDSEEAEGSTEEYATKTEMTTTIDYSLSDDEKLLW